MPDMKFALRQFAKSPGFAITVILTISLGIGANTAIFTLVHAILLRSLPVANPASLYRVGDLDDWRHNPPTPSTATTKKSPSSTSC